MHRRHRTYTVGIVGVRDGAQTGNGSPCTLLQDGGNRYAHAHITQIENAREHCTALTILVGDFQPRM